MTALFSLLKSDIIEAALNKIKDRKYFLVKFLTKLCHKTHLSLGSWLNLHSSCGQHTMLIEEAKYGTYKNKRICKRDPNFKLKWWELAIPFWNIHKVTQCASKCHWFCPAGSAKTIVKNYQDKCDGQHACELLPTNEMQGDPCKKDKYAYVRYTCLKDGDLKQLRPYTKSLLVHAPKVKGKFQGVGRRS